MKIFIFIVMLLLPFVVYSEDQTSAVLIELALQGQPQETGFYLNSKGCSNKDNLHVAYDQKKDILVFGYFISTTGMVKNYMWDRKLGRTSTVSCKFDETIDPKKVVKISEREMQDSALKFRSDWISCK